MSGQPSLAQGAFRRAQQRLQERYRDEFAEMKRQERIRVGLPPEVRTSRVEQLENENEELRQRLARAENALQQRQHVA